VSINATLFVQAIVFLLLVLFTMRFVWPPIAKALDDRAQKIAAGLAAADKAKAELQSANQRVEQELSASRTETASRLADAERRAQRKALADVPRTEERDYLLDRNSRISPSELNRKRTAEPDAAGVAGYSSPTYDNTIDRLSPSELKARKTQTAEAVPAGTEPKRARLTDPPSGYRTPASTAPYKAPEAEASWYKKINPFSSEGH